MTGNIDISDTSKAREQCGVLDSTANYYTELVNELRNAKTKIQANWEGDAAAIYDVIARIEQVIATFDASIIPAVTGLSASVVQFAEEIDKVRNNTIDNESGNPSGTPVVTPGDGSAPTTSTTPSSSGGGVGNIVGGAATGAAIGAGIGSIIPGVGTAIGAAVGAAIGGVSGGVGAAVDGANTFEDAFWNKHGENFVEAWTSRDWTDQWDYSECEGVIDVLGQTVDGVLGTASDVIGGVVDTVGAGVNFVVDGIGELFGGLFG